MHGERLITTYLLTLRQLDLSADRIAYRKRLEELTIDGRSGVCDLINDRRLHDTAVAAELHTILLGTRSDTSPKYLPTHVLVVL